MEQQRKAHKKKKHVMDTGPIELTGVDYTLLTERMVDIEEETI